ncbi:MAG: hypothetical protein PHT89_02550 [Lachnospiraceae bacterium]|nr:hypothetical protein [Lachnospiraceae bacterium]MDD3659581.1 hypothetical protein [Lachnospiraceae bacterium]
MRKITKLLLLGVMCLQLGMVSMSAYAVSENSTDAASSDVKSQYYAELANYKNNLYIVNDVTDEAKIKIEKLYSSANTYIANNTMSESEIASYISTIKGQMDAVITSQNSDKPATTKEFITVGDNCPTPEVKFGETVNVILPIINLGTENITNITINPVTSATVSEWPFEIQKSGYTELVADLPGNKTKADAITNRREVTYQFKAREDVLSGYYKLTYNLTYSVNGTIETTTLTTYVKTIGAPGSGSIDQTADDTSKMSTPRIIITGFETTPAEVFAGDTFTLTVHVKNTSQRTAVSNVEFDLEAAVEGKDETATYAAFLPTSGSNTVYINQIPQGGTDALTIEMTAKADLAQKPYALNIKMKYEDEKYNPYESTTSVSIPILQESKFETSTPEIMPAGIMVGEQANIMFSIYNTGKTTLYNTQVKFIGESISGGETFVGKVEPGATGNVDAMVNGIAPTMDEGMIKVEISYEDAAGNITTSEKEISLYVSEMMDPGIDGGFEEEIPVEENSNSKIMIAVVAVAVIAVIAVIIIVIKKKKKKKAELELQKEIEGIDEP